MPEYLMIFLGGLMGGFVNGLTGFGTALTGMPFWLAALPPVAAAQLAAACSVSGQLQTMHLVWRHIRWLRALPLVAGGLLGVPFGTWMLPHVSVPDFKLFVGLVLVGYCSAMLAIGPRPRAAFQSILVDGLVGIFAGVLGGLAGLSGVLPVLYASWLGWTRDERRGVFQVFNGTILLAVLVSSALAGLATRAYLTALPLAVPGTILGVYLGSRVYHTLDDRRYDRLVLALLLASGIALVVASQTARPS